MKHYFIFGEVAAKIYHNEGFDKLFDMQSDDQTSIELCLHEYDSLRHTPSDLLEAYDGWGGYAEITESEYNQLVLQIK